MRTEIWYKYRYNSLILLRDTIGSRSQVPDTIGSRSHIASCGTGFRDLWQKLKHKRTVTNGVLTQEEFDTFKIIPNVVTLKKLSPETIKYGFPVTKSDIRCKFSNWLKYPAATIFILKIYEQMHNSVKVTQGSLQGSYYWQSLSVGRMSPKHPDTYFVAPHLRTRKMKH